MRSGTTAYRDDFALLLSIPRQQLAQYGNDEINEEKVVAKFLYGSLKKYPQLKIAIETMLDMLTLTIEEVAGRFKAVNDETVMAVGETVSMATSTTPLSTATVTSPSRGEGGLLPIQAVGSAGRANLARHEKAPRAGSDACGGAKHAASDKHKSIRDNNYHNCGRTGHWAKECRQPKRGQARLAQAAVDDKGSLLLAHRSINRVPAAPTATALLHLDKPHAHIFLSDNSSDDKMDGWHLDIGVTHHMTECQEFFSDLFFLERVLQPGHRHARHVNSTMGIRV
jgi:hypothetical protein